MQPAGTQTSHAENGRAREPEVVVDRCKVGWGSPGPSLAPPQLPPRAWREPLAICHLPWAPRTWGLRGALEELGRAHPTPCSVPVCASPWGGKRPLGACPGAGDKGVSSLSFTLSRATRCPWLGASAPGALRFAEGSRESS